MKITITGQVRSIGEETQVTEKFKKQDVTIEIDQDSDYPQVRKIQFSQDKCKLAGELNVGDTANFVLNLRGKEYTNKDGKTDVFNSDDCWNVEVTKKENPDEIIKGPNNSTQNSMMDAPGMTDNTNSDLPF